MSPMVTPFSREQPASKAPSRRSRRLLRRLVSTLLVALLAPGLSCGGDTAASGAEQAAPDNGAKAPPGAEPQADSPPAAPPNAPPANTPGNPAPAGFPGNLPPVATPQPVNAPPSTDQPGTPPTVGATPSGAPAQPPVPVGLPELSDPEACGGAGLHVDFSHERGWYSGAQTLTLTPCEPRPNTQIYYAIGGGLPSQPYAGPFVVEDDGLAVTVRARLVIDGAPVRLQTHTLVFMPDVGGAVVAMNDNDLPVALGKLERTVTFEFIPSPLTGLVPVSDEAGSATNMQGQSAGTSDKVYFRKEYGKGTLHGDVFGDLFFGPTPTDRHDHLFLRSHHTDKTMLRNIIAHDTLSALGQLSPHGRLVDFYDNGTLRGTRYLHERPEGGFMESYTGIQKPRWIAVNGFDALGTTLDSSVMFGSWEEAERLINVSSLVDFLLVQWHAGPKDYQPLVRNWRATGPVALQPDAEPEYRWHFFNWDIDRGYMRNNRRFGSPMNIWERIEQFPEARAIFQERVQCAFFNGGPLTTAAMMQRLRLRHAQLQSSMMLAEPWSREDALADREDDLEDQEDQQDQELDGGVPEEVDPRNIPEWLDDITGEVDRFMLEMELWLSAREQYIRDDVLEEWMLAGCPAGHDCSCAGVER